MKRLSTIMMCLFAMMAASLSAKAQEITFLMRPGWNWIAYPYPESVSVETAFGDFEPTPGDVIESEFGYSEYFGGYGWFGGIQNLEPGKGYMYYSNRTEVVSFVFGETAPKLTVTTAEPTDITATSAISGGSITSNDGSYVFVLEKGICWATHPNPIVINDFYTENGEGVDSFIVEMSNLDLNTVYYVRAYFVTANGTFYGDEKIFTTRDGIPTVITDSITNISRFRATCYGTVTDDGGLDVTTRGVCWSTNHNPTLNDNYTVDNLGLGNFFFDMTRLYINTTYYVRTYVTNSYTTVYGNELSFVTDESVGNGNAPVGAINGLFSTNHGQVYFAKGNLQYQASTNTWRFAENQWDYIGEDNENTSPTYDGWIDLFSWGSGADPTNQSNNQTYNEWGVNPIINGGNQEGEWRTLSGCYNTNAVFPEEWPYILNRRQTLSGIRYAKAQVNGVNGVVVVPDDWDSSVYGLNNTNSSGASFDSNIISDIEWENFFEETGCVFLPAGGWRVFGSEQGPIFGEGEVGCYWSSSGRDDHYPYYNPGQIQWNAFYVGFSNSDFITESYDSRSKGYSVRLVKDYNP